MKCPYCGEEMVAGFIQCRDGMFWTPRKSLIASLSRFQKGALRLSENSSAVAYRCDRCKKILLDYSKS